MEKKFKYIDLLDRHYKNELNDKEITVFNKKLGEDQEFAKEYELYQSMIITLKLEKRKRIKEQLKKVKKQLDEEGFFQEKKTTKEKEPILVDTQQISTATKTAKISPTRSGRQFWLIGIAASFLLLIGAFGLIQTQYSNKALADASILYSKAGVPRGEPAKNPLEQGRDALEDGNFKEASQFFETIPSTDEYYVNARFYLAYAQYQLAAYQKTIDNTRLVLSQQPLDAEFKYKSEWLLIQTLLATDQINSNEFQQLFTKITEDTKHRYYKQALELSQNLNSFWRKLVL